AARPRILVRELAADRGEVGRGLVEEKRRHERGAAGAQRAADLAEIVRGVVAGEVREERLREDEPGASVLDREAVAAGRRAAGRAVRGRDLGELEAQARIRGEAAAAPTDRRRVDVEPDVAVLLAETPGEGGGHRARAAAAVEHGTGRRKQSEL